MSRLRFLGWNPQSCTGDQQEEIVTELRNFDAVLLAGTQSVDFTRITQAFRLFDVDVRVAYCSKRRPARPRLLVRVEDALLCWEAG